LRPESRQIGRAREDGLTVITDDVEAASIAEVAVILIPDSRQAAFYKLSLEKYLPASAAMIFAHGISIHYKWIEPRKDLDVILVAPLGQGEAVRAAFGQQRSPHIKSVAQDNTVKAWKTGCDNSTAIARDANQFQPLR
jgi:ketol-acid reductoisomerase